MSEQDGTHKTALQRPAPHDKEAWKAHWEQQGQPWRTEPEIDAERQQYLAERRNIKPNIEQGIYPFRCIKLSRADVEWLLATHQNGCGPVDWSDKRQRTRQGIDLRGADLRQTDLHGLPLACMCGGLKEAEWIEATLEQRDMAGVHLEGATLREAHLEEAILCKAHLEGADLREIHLEGADLYRAYLEGAYFRKAHLGGTSLRKSFIDSATSFDGAVLEDEKLGFALFADVHWGDINLSNVNWAQIKILGDEYWARQAKRWNGKIKTQDEQLKDYQRAVRGNRQLAAVLRNQGMNEEADHFAYRAQLLQRVVLRRQRRWLKYVLSWFLYLIAGYGYRPLRSLIIYLLLIVGFATGYYAVTHVLHAQPYPLAWYEALIVSVSSFHGRGFFQPVQNLGDPVAILASIEAVFGLLIEISFIATFTQRFFGK